MRVVFILFFLIFNLSLSLHAAEGGKAKETTVAARTVYETGDSVSVEWNGKWYPAHVLEVNAAKNSFKIHYDGYSASWDEWVGSSRIKK